MAFAVNILALLLVVGLCWLAMMWVTRRSHDGGTGFGHDLSELFDPEFPESATAGAGESCPACDGVGAEQTGGKQLRPCAVCEGTGVR